MKKLVLKGLLFLVIGLPLYMAAHRVVYTTYRKPLTLVVQQALARALTEHAYDRVIVGDSVAEQLFNTRNQSRSRYLHLTSNAATTMLGHYILLMELLQRNTIREIVVLLNPYSFGDNLNRIYTANYVVGLFYREPYLSYFTPYAIQQIKNCRWWFVPVLLRDYPELCTINYQRVNDVPFNTEAYLSPISIEYLMKLRQVCISRNIQLRILAPPLSEKMRGLDYAFAQEQARTNGLNDIMSDYFNFSALPEEAFADEMHYKGPFLDRARDLLDLAWQRDP